MTNTELTVGEVRAMYFDETALRLPPVSLYRMNVKGDRHYFSVNDDGNPEFYSGVTTVTSRMIPKDEYLVKWIAEKGYDDAIAYRDERAHYGTLMHTLFAELLITRKISLDLVDSYVEAYAIRENLSVDQSAWAEDLRQDLVGLATFIKDYNVRPLAIELSLCSPEDGIAGTVDLPCLMDIPTEGDWGEKYASGPRKGEVKLTKEPVTFACIVDFKSGRNNQGGEYNAAQLRCYEILLSYNFPDIFDLVSHPMETAPVELDMYQITPSEIRVYDTPGQTQVRLFNFSPKNWRSEPGYHLTEQTQNFSRGEAELMLDWWKAKCERSPVEDRTKIFFHGVLDLEAETSESYTAKTVQELASERIIMQDDEKFVQFGQWQYETLSDLIKNESDAL